MESNTFLRRANRNCGAALWKPATRRMSLTRYWYRAPRTCQVHQLRRVARRHAARLVHGEELEVAHVGHDGVAHLRRVAHGPEVEPEVALGGGVHGAGHRQAAAVVLQGGDVLLHRAGHDHVQVPGVGPHAGDDARPVAAGALGADEARQLRVRAEDAHDGVGDGRVGHVRG